MLFDLVCYARLERTVCTLETVVIAITICGVIERVLSRLNAAAIALAAHLTGMSCIRLGRRPAAARFPKVEVRRHKLRSDSEESFGNLQQQCVING